MKKVNSWNVYLGDQLIDTVYYDKSCDEWYVKHTLINHDGYDPNIEVRK